MFRASLLLLAALVPAATGFRGETSQKRPASVVAGADGLVTRIRIGYSAPCADPRYRFPNVMRFEPPFKTSTPDEVVATLTLRERLRGGGRTRQTATVTARRTGDGWRGTFKTRVILTRGGRRLDKCELRRVTWRARLTASASP